MTPKPKNTLSTNSTYSVLKIWKEHYVANNSQGY